MTSALLPEARLIGRGGSVRGTHGRSESQVKVGVVREIKPDEGRVALTPAGVAALVKAGHQVYVEKGAGEGSSLSDEAYQAAGAIMLSSAAEVWGTSDMILKVKEPLAQEYGHMREGQILFTYLHLAADPALTWELMNRKVVAIAYETVQLPNGSLPLLTPMSEVAGRMSVQIGAHFLEKPYGGRGVLLGGVTGVPRGEVVILGGGTVGTNAAKVAVGLGANVTIFDISRSRLQYLDDIFQGRLQTRMSNPYDIAEALTRADLVVDAVLVPGARTPTLVTREMVKAMQPGSVIVDVAVDQGGSVETIDRVTTHHDPVYVVDGVVHYAVPNIPGAVPRTSTFALAGVTLPYALEIANKGWRRALKEDPALARGANVIDGQITYKAVAEANDLPYTPLERILN